MKGGLGRGQSAMAKDSLHQGTQRLGRFKVLFLLLVPEMGWHSAGDRGTENTPLGA